MMTLPKSSAVSARFRVLILNVPTSVRTLPEEVFNDELRMALATSLKVKSYSLRADSEISMVTSSLRAPNSSTSEV